MATLSLKNWKDCKEDLAAAGVKLPTYDAGAVKAIVATIDGVTDTTGETVTINGSSASYGTVSGTSYSGWYVIVTETADAATIAVTAPAAGG